MKNRYILLSLIITQALLCHLSVSAQNTFYFPDRVLMTGFRQAGEFKAVLTAKPQVSYDLDWFLIPLPSLIANFSPAVDVAFSPTDHLSIFSSYRALWNRQPEDREYGYYENNGQGSYDGYTLEIGAGYFNRMTEKLILEAGAGYGNGKIGSSGFIVDDHLPGTAALGYNYNTRYHRAFFQSAASLRNRNSLFTLGYRITAQTFYDLKLSDPSLSYVYNGDKPLSNSYLTNKVFYIAQPFIGLEVGHKYAKFNAQLGYSQELGDRILSGMSNTGIYMSVGLSCNLQFFNSSKVY